MWTRLSEEWHKSTEWVEVILPNDDICIDLAINIIANIITPSIQLSPMPSRSRIVGCITGYEFQFSPAALNSLQLQSLVFNSAFGDAFLFSTGEEINISWCISHPTIYSRP